jgi:hypothetical protein
VSEHSEIENSGRLCHFLDQTIHELWEQEYDMAEHIENGLKIAILGCGK